ncbi:MAG TPA: hypothetical protein VIH42_06100 [Thermoguttaceae bacterium]
MHIEELTRLLGIIVIAGLCIGLAFAISFAAPAIKDASVAIVGMKAAPELAKATVDAAQYALQAKKDADRLALLEKEREIENAALLAKAEADRKIQDGLTNQEQVRSQSSLYLNMAMGIGVLLLIGLSIFGFNLWSAQRAEHKQLDLAATRQAEEFKLLQDRQTKEWEIKKAEVEVIDKMVDAAIEKGFAITTPSGHTFTPPVKIIGEPDEQLRISDSNPMHEPAVFADNLSGHKKE